MKNDGKRTAAPFGNGEKGLSLIELILTIVIIGILAAIAAVKYINLSEAGKEAACKTNQVSLETAQTLYYSDHYIQGDGGYASELDELAPYVSSGTIPVCPKGPSYVVGTSGRITCPLAEHARPAD
jgi:prepilin-type N-terminal cleavage/methylation domain-containing protein